MPPAISRRRFLVLTGGLAAATATGAGGLLLRREDPSRVLASSREVLVAEGRRRGASARVVERTLTATSMRLAVGEREVSTWGFGSLPGPEIRLRAGDVLRAHVRNELAEPTALHWHGIALRNDMDGVPGVTQQPIPAGKVFTYEFTVPDPGTYIYHSHSGVQLDRGLYGALVVEDPEEPGDYDAEVTLVLDDWLDGIAGTPEETLEDLQSGASGMTGMSGHGMHGTSDGAGGMLGTDTGDVDYPLFLVNGRPPEDPFVVEARAGQRIRMRVVNVAADRPFRFAVGGHELTVTHTDGFPVDQVRTDAVLIGMGERYDLIVTARDGAFPISAVPEGSHTGAMAVLRTSAAAAPRPDVRPLELDRRVTEDAGLRASEKVRLPARAADRELAIRLDGDMRDYRWTVNGRRFDPGDIRASALDVRDGERVRLTMENRSMMFHPMHLHGHTFQLRGRRLDGPRKDTVVVRPMETVVAEFDADNPGQWVLHCHNIYHAEAGMTSIVSYVR